MRATSGNRVRGRLVLPATATATAVLAAATLAACAAPGPAAQDPSSARSTGGRYEPRTEKQTLEFAEELLVRDCMRKRGYRYWVSMDTSESLSSAFPYVIDDARWARSHGYGTDLRRALEREALRDPNQQYLYSMPPDRRPALIAALNGPAPQGLEARLPTGIRVTHSDRGCTAEAERQLYKDLPAWFRATRVTNSLAGMRIGQVMDDKRYRAAAGSWARCMRDRNHPYKNPAETRAAATLPGAPWPRAKEVALASAEAACATATPLASVARALDAEYRKRLGERHPHETADRARLAREALPRARAVIAREG
ncbi:hypothetical protein [Streptomyces sp. NBC_01538]|uniref:hypothetical protein n=1 Tax=Streptomyces sp. NBC_01538 TaxID=2903897 RepID=UPI00386B4A36